MKTDQEPYNQTKTMKNQPGTIENNDNQPGTIKNMKSQPWTMKNHEKPTSNHEKP